MSVSMLGEFRSFQPGVSNEWDVECHSALNQSPVGHFIRWVGQSSLALAKWPAPLSAKNPTRPSQGIWRGCHVITLRPRHNGRFFADDTSQCPFWYQYNYIFVPFSLKFVPTGLSGNKSALVQITAYRWTGDNPLSEPSGFSGLMGTITRTESGCKLPAMSGYSRYIGTLFWRLPDFDTIVDMLELIFIITISKRNAKVNILIISLPKCRLRIRVTE